jgi:hypothetical protein
VQSAASSIPRVSSILIPSRGPWVRFPAFQAPNIGLTRPAHGRPACGPIYQPLMPEGLPPQGIAALGRQTYSFRGTPTEISERRQRLDQTFYAHIRKLRHAAACMTICNWLSLREIIVVTSARPRC